MQLLRGRQKKAQASSEQDVTAAVPTLAGASPEYAALLDKKAQVSAELVAVEKEIAATWEKLHEKRTDDATRLQQARISAILGDEVDELSESRKAMGDSLSALDSRVRDLKAALAELDKRLADAGTRASQVICDQVEPQHRELVLAMVEKLRELHEAHLAYWQFTQALQSEGIAWTRLGVMHPTFLGAPQDHQGRAAHFFLEAERHGFINREDIPAEFIR